MLAAPLTFPSADGPSPTAGACAPARPDLGLSAVRPWPTTATVIGALCALDALFIALRDGLGWSAGWVAGVTLAVAALTGLLLARRLNDPIRTLSARAEQLALRYTGHAVDRRRNEVQNLVASFEAMTGALLGQLERHKGLHLEELQNSLELQRRYALMRVLRNLSTAALECEQFEQVLERAVEELGGYLDWPIGRVLIVDQLAERSLWFVADPDRFAQFIAASQDLGAEHSGQGLIGLAGATGMPHWGTDLDRLAQWQRREMAVRSGLKSGFAIPIPGDGSTHAFIEFFSDHRVEASAEMIELVDAIHTELWQAGQWRRDRLRRADSSGPPNPVNPLQALQALGASGR
ncbi:MAG TPA: GAF domain-containing protein [Burkholderiaceae bacterium]|jgi:HAMP domain-containing protein|nr:GAF domain-containing protein [Burkholderiaceae bacterium]